MRWLLDHQMMAEDFVLAVSLFFNVLTVLGLLVVMDVRFAYWRQRRAWRKAERESRENIRNPAYGMKPRA